MTPTDTVKLTIDDKAQSYAKIYSSLLSDEFQRKRAYASISALYALINLVEKTNYEIQKSMTIFRNPVLNEQYEISDLYINNWHIDVRVLTDGDAFLVPKIHFESDILPDFYAVVKVDSQLKSAELLGFADTRTIEKEGFDYHYYSVANSCLLSYEKFLDIVESKKTVNFTEEDHNLFKENYLSLMDNELDKNTKNRILKHLFACSDCRTEFCCFTGFEMVSCNTSKYPELLEDQTLNIIGAQAVDAPKYENKEETIYIGESEQEEEAQKDDSLKQELKKELKEEIKEEIKKEIQEENINVVHVEEETVSDILDELFNIEEDTIPVNVTLSDKPVIDTISAKDIIDNEDLNILNDDGTETDTLLDLHDNTSDIEIITEEPPKPEHFTEEELDIIEENFLDIRKKPDLVFIEENTDEPSITEESKEEDPEIILETPTVVEDKTTEDAVEKVIVDYDEFGEPVYSYITNVANSTPDSEISEIEDINEDLPILNDLDDDEYAKDNQNKLENTSDFEQYDNSTNEDILDVDSSDSGYSAEDDFAYNEKIEEDPLFANEDANADYEDDEFNESEEEYDSSDDSKVAEDDNDAISDEEENNDEEDAEGEEDEDEDFDLDNPEIKKAGSKKGLIAALFIIIFALAAGGAFFGMKYINAATNTASADIPNQAEIPDNTQTNDMFEQPADQPEQSDLFESQNNGTISTDTAINGDIPTSGSIEIPQTGSIEAPQAGSIEIPASENLAPNQLTEKDLLKPQNNGPTGDVNKVMSNAFSQGTNNVSIRGVNWMCAPNLFTDRTFKSYLQSLDNILKLNLRKNILDASDIPSNNSVAVKMAIDNEGNLIKSLVSSSSGSEQIDNIVLQSIKETLESQKTQILNDSEQKADKYYLQVVIKL